MGLASSGSALQASWQGEDGSTTFQRYGSLPAIARPGKIWLLHHPAEIRNAALNWLDTTVASGMRP